MSKENKNRPSGKLSERVKEKIKDTYSRIEEKRARQDVVFTETLTPKPEEPAPTVVRGGIDFQLVIIVLALLTLGAIMSFSASYVYAEQKFGDSLYYFKNYILFALLAIGITAVFVAFITPRLLKMFGVGVYGLSIILLLLVLVVGTAGNGAQRWLEIGPISIQPSEIAKMAVVMMLALYMSHFEKEIASRRKFGGSFVHGVLVPVAFIGAVCALVMLEHHISGVIIIGLIGLSVMYMGGTDTKWMLIILGALALAAIFLVLVSSYAQERVNTWIHIDEVDPLGSAWQTLQGRYAIGSGGLFGVGLGKSRQKNGYVAEPQNDFVFTIVCEELGFVGAVIVMGLFALYTWRGMKIASRCPDKYMKLVASGLTFKVALQAILNIAVVTNTIPNTGVSLPFFSSGGTALAIQIFEAGILLFISRYSAEKKN